MDNKRTTTRMNNKRTTTRMAAAILFHFSLFTFAASAAEGGWNWIDGKTLPIEGKAFADTERYYDRLPACWSNDYTREVWQLQRDSAGLAFRFTTDADKLRVRWSLTGSNLSMPHMPATGVSGVDVYQYGRDLGFGQWRNIVRWNYCEPPFPSSLPTRQFTNEFEVAVVPGRVTMVYLPTYNGIAGFSLGLPEGKTVKPAPVRESGVVKPVVFYGTSTTQGGCTSRPSTAWPSIAGREADVPIVNLGFSGAGKMEDVMLEALARIDASLYVLDTVGNMDTDLIAERFEKFVRELHRRKPATPIMMTVNWWLLRGSDRNWAVKRLYKKLKRENSPLSEKLYLGGDDFKFCSDRNFTVEGVHLNDWGAWQVGRGFAEEIRQALGLNRPKVVKAEGGMTTPWGDKVTPENAWREYPRPQLRRADWMCLNGLWDYAVVAATDPKPSAWEGKILVPFAFESKLSGVMRDIEPTDRMWYRRTFTAPAVGEDERFLINFDGVDWRAQVFVNGCETLEAPHEGPLGFTVDATPFLKPGENTLEVLAWDPTGTDGAGPVGKQKLGPCGCVYHRVSGIWQTVWAEKVPATHLEAYRLEPDFDAGVIRVQPVVAGDAMNAKVSVEVSDGGKRLAASEVQRLDDYTAIKLPEGWQAWCPENPKLYDLRITVANARTGAKDVTEGYFGMRKIEKRKDGNGIWRFFLNGRPVYLMGVLDQGYWPDGLWTPPSDEAMAFDLKFFKDCGMNFVRKHVKVEPLRWYYLCDRLGLLVLQDLTAPCGSKGIVNEFNAEAHDRLVAAHRRSMAETMRLLQPSPSVIAWSVYNEGGTQPWAVQTHAALAWAKRRDPARLVGAPSGWVDFDGGGWRHLEESVAMPLAPTEVAEEKGDFVDMHHYPEPGMPTDSTRISFLSEWGGIGLLLKGHLWAPDAWGYAEEPTTAALEKRYLDMVGTLEDLARKGLSGSVYTQATDCEREATGLLTYDRRVAKVRPEAVRAAHVKVLKAVADEEKILEYQKEKTK